jgi:hypothetical protein
MKSHILYVQYSCCIHLKWLKKLGIVCKFSYFYNNHGFQSTPETWIIYAFALFVHLFPSIDTDNWDYAVF